MVTFRMALMQTESIISMAAGTMPRPMTADTALHADLTSGNTPSRVVTDSGTGSRRTAIFVAMPKVPSEPTNTPRRSYPGTSRAVPPSHTADPSSITTSMPSTWLVVTPYARQ